MTAKELQQIAITSAVAAAAGGVASAFVSYFVTKALEEKYGEKFQSRLTDALYVMQGRVRPSAPSQPPEPQLGAWRRYR